jgi:hypothetical protein
VLYIESFGNPREFARTARRVGARDYVLVTYASDVDALYAAGWRSASGQELDRAGQRGQVRVVVLGDLRAGTLAQNLDET